MAKSHSKSLATDISPYKDVKSKVSVYVSRETASPFKAHLEHMQAVAKEEQLRKQASQVQVMMSPSARQQMAMEKRRKALYPT